MRGFRLRSSLYDMVDFDYDLVDKLSQKNNHDLYLKIRRLFELLLIFILSPFIIFIFAITALIVLIDVGKPVIFVQQRPGKHSVFFDVYKFRTMTIMRKSLNESSEHPEQFVTKTGAFLRKFRLDELPQIWNIIKNDMSLIGPRPEPAFYYLKCIEEFPEYKFRYLLKPGLTGWAQIKFRHTDDIEGAKTKFKYDMYYISNLSPWLDLKILVLTVKTILTGFGAR